MRLKVIHRGAIPTALSLLVSPIAMADVVRHGSLPEAYWGAWVGAGEPSAESGVIVLSAKSYISGEAICGVDWVSETAGVRGAVYSAHLRCTKHERNANETTAKNLIVRPNSIDWIEVGSDYANLKPYRRCSAPCLAARRGHPPEH